VAVQGDLRRFFALETARFSAFVPGFKCPLSHSALSLASADASVIRVGGGPDCFRQPWGMSAHDSGTLRPLRLQGGGCNRRSAYRIRTCGRVAR